MWKKMLAGWLAAAMLAAPALAEAYQGTSVARETIAICAAASGVLEEVNMLAGDCAAAGECLAKLRSEKIYASQDGYIARIHAQAGDEADGSVVEISPVSRYTIYCTAAEGYNSTQGRLLHAGETLYMRCTSNGTHQGFGRVYAIDGESYMVEALGGEFYVGETVYLYRDADFRYAQLVGSGTVVSHDPEIYASEGRVTAMHVAQGEYVERGELLYEVIAGEDINTVAPVSGIITDCNVRAGDTVEQGQIIGHLALQSDICISIQVDESASAQISAGDSAALIYADDDQERLIPGEVIEISRVAGEDGYAVYIAPETPPARLGMTVSVRIG